MDSSFRFVHAGDFHLERPPGGLAEVPEHLRVTIGEAPYRAAERVFDTAIKHRVDFLLLAGDVVAPHIAGPRSVVFLNEQFAKLADAGIRVYWAGSPTDDFDRWADLWPLPDHVYRFPTDRVERIIHHRAGEPLLQILGGSSGRLSGQRIGRIHGSDFVADGDLFAVAVAHGAVDSDSLARRPIPYWALGGEHARRSLLGGTVTAHYCGSPQGRTPDETGPHGCTLVQVDDERRVRTTFVPTDAVRYCHERITLDSTVPGHSLISTIQERLSELLTDPFGPDLLIHWTLFGNDALAQELRSAGSAELLAKLRTDHGSKHPAAWSVEIDLGTAHVAAEWFEEDTLLGEFLRSVKHCLEHPDERINLEDFLAERHLAGNLAHLASLNDSDLRRRVLTDAAALGIQLLSPVEERS
jgi:hypothetical protein